MYNLDNPDYEIFIEGEPRPKQSFKIRSSVSGRIRGYTPKRIIDWGNKIKQEVVANYRNSPIDGKIEINLVFYLSNNRTVDCDNLSKLVLDSLEGTLFMNDRNIVSLHISKIVNKEKPGVLVQIKRCHHG